MPDRLLNVPAILEAGVSDVVSVFDAFDVGIYCADLDGIFTYVNPAGQTLLGWDAEELLGRRAHDVIHHSQPDGSPFPLDEIVRSTQRSRGGLLSARSTTCSGRRTVHRCRSRTRSRRCTRTASGSAPSWSSPISASGAATPSCCVAEPRSRRPWPQSGSRRSVGAGFRSCSIALASWWPRHSTSSSPKFSSCFRRGRPADGGRGWLARGSGG